MKIAARERRTILIGLVLAVVVGGYTWVVRPLVRKMRGASTVSDQLRGQFADARTRIGRYDAARRELNVLTANLHVEVPTDSPPDQMKRLVEKFEQIAGRSGVQIKNITQLKSQARATATRGPARTELKLDITCQSSVGLVRFVDNLEQAGVPIVAEQITITTAGGRGGTGGAAAPSRSRGPAPGPGGPGGPGGPPKREIQAALKVYTYLFPEKAQQ